MSYLLSAEKRRLKRFSQETNQDWIPTFMERGNGPQTETLHRKRGKNFSGGSSSVIQNKLDISYGTRKLRTHVEFFKKTGKMKFKQKNYSRNRRHTH